MSNDQGLLGSVASEFSVANETSQEESDTPRLMQLHKLKSNWKVWLVSFAVWTFIALMTAFSMYRFKYLFWKPPASFWDELRIPLVNNLIFAAFTPIMLQASLRYPIER